MSTSLLHNEASTARLALRSSYRSGPSAEGPWHVRICGGQVLSDRLARMPQLAFAPEVNA